MKIKNFLKRYQKQTIIIAIFAIIFLCVFIPSLSNRVNTSAWNGVVATSFTSGNGTNDNPYVISNAGEYAYLKNLLEGENASLYNDKYYTITGSFNYGNYDMSINTETFTGTIDGLGNIINNATITNHIFNNLTNATIKNLNIIDSTLNVTDNYGGILANTSSNSTISFVSVSASVTSSSYYYGIGGLIYSDTGSTLTNIAINNTYDGNTSYIGSILYSGTNTNLTNIIVKTDNYNDYYSNNNITSNNVSTFTVASNKIVLTSTDQLDTYTSDDYYMDIEANNLYVTNNDYTDVENDFVYNTASFDIHDSGISGDTVYVNDLASDYYYYKGKNYTDTTNGQLPTSVDKQIYTDSNLVKVYIKYSGTDLVDSTKIGYVSTTEAQSNYIYYDYYVVKDGYIDIELIDNPFTNRPTDQAFNGWVTGYKNAVITYHDDYYTRHCKVPVTFTNGVPNDIEITFNASWITATTYTIDTTSDVWSSAFESLNSKGMKQLNGYEPSYGDMSSYYVYGGSISRGRYYPDNSYDYYGNNISGNYCYSRYGCTYYLGSGSTYSPGTTYYTASSGSMTIITPTATGYTKESNLPTGSLAVGYYKGVTISYGSSITGYYNDLGVSQTGTCYTSGGCYYYKLIQYSDDGVNPNLVQENANYYYLVTRDTNIIILNARATTTWSSSNTKPFTLTSVYNGNDYRNSAYFNVYSLSVHCYADTVIENIKIYNTIRAATSDFVVQSGTTQTRYFYGDWHNVKLGRGITQNGSYINFTNILGGGNTDTGSSSNITKYRLTVESGKYNSGSLTDGYVYNNYDAYVNAQGLYGNDYDRVNNNNSNLVFNSCLSGSWGGAIRGSSNTDIALDSVYKSGTYGASKADNIQGIYVGGRHSGTQYSARRGRIQGGWFYNVIGGPLTDSSQTGYNDLYLYITGGEVTIVTAGAGRTATYGNRIVQMTGGVVDNSLFGGSNGSGGSDGDGTVVGSSYVYVGGTAEIGSESNVTNNTTFFGAESGSVFGIGNGRSGYSSIGSNDNSNVIITDEALIRRNVYGGGNYGAVGVSSDYDTSTTNIQILGATINGSVYGGGNNNGSGTTSKTSTVNIKMLNGTVKGSIYGGSRTNGTIYGSTNLYINGGTINTDIYGGGEGNNTFVTHNVNVNVGDTSLTSVANVDGSVYGGSAYGTVNGEETTTTVSDYQTITNINSGIITNSVFGGGKGSSSYTPYVEGNITVNINGGNIGNVFGGCDAAGTPNGTDVINLNGGIVGSVYGGGNNASVPITNIYQNNSTVTNIYGGSNSSGDVTTSNITVTGGTTGDIYGGNNLGGTCGTTNVTVNNGTITNSIYGGGNAVDTTTSNITLNNAAAIIPNVYGGGKSASVTTTNVTQNGPKVTNLFGGSNTSGTVNTAIITHTKGETTNIYGGNNAGGNTIDSTINYASGTTENIYGGGNQANSGNATINITNGTITNLFGGGNSAGITSTTTNITNGTITNIYGGSNNSGTVTTSNIIVDNVTSEALYGGNNLAGNTISSTIKINNGTITNVYGGGNIATGTSSNITVNGGNFNNIYGGGNQAELQSNTLLNINGGTITNNIYGGGNYGVVDGNTNLYINGATVLGSAYGGGNGASAIVSGNTTIDISGNTVIGSTTSKSPESGCVFGSGNAAATGTSDTNTSISTANVHNGKIYGNVYGGANTSVVYGQAKVNIGYQAPTTGTDVTLSYDTSSDTFSNDEGTITLNSTFKTTTGGYWSNFLNVSNKLNKIVTNYTLVLYLGDNTINSCYNCNYTVNGKYATITPSVYSTGQTTIAANGNYDLSGSWNIVDASQIKAIAYYTENITDANLDMLNNKDITINGTIFGGGEANASGSENYDYSFISVTNGIDLNIDGTGYNTLNTYGSIFGSGDASSTSGTSTITIKNYGSYESVQKNISIQRTNTLTIDNSSIMLSGATDRTNEYSDVLFTLSIIDDLKIKNGSNLFLKTGSNLLKLVESQTESGEVATVTIDDEGNATKNVDNRIYMYEGKNLNIATNESVTEYGNVSGMSFLGIFTIGNDDEIVTNIYNRSVNNGDDIIWTGMATKGSYVLGAHKANHDIKVDGFYSNIMDTDAGTVSVKYITPTPEDSNFYMWVVGEGVIEYNIDLVASKYSTLGSTEFSFLDFSAPNTSFQILDFDYSQLADGINLIDPNDVPRVAYNNDANTNFALQMEASNTGWLTKGTTTFLSSNPTVNGTKYYQGENSSNVPSMLFYLIHSKNITVAQDMGTVSINIMAITAVDALTKVTKRLVINVNLTTALYQTNEYEAAMTPGDKYSLFTSTTTNITTTSKFSALYSLYGENTNLYKTGYHRELISDYALPAKTKITMIDFVEGSPKYYYHVITSDEETAAQTSITNTGEAAYNFSLFTSMGSLSDTNHYDDEQMRYSYYINNNSSEEFIFIVDFEDASITENQLNKSLLVELRDSNEQTIISVLGIEHTNMMYSLYNNSESVINVTGTVDSNPLYVGHNATIDANITYQNSAVNSTTIYDTQYFNSKMGIQVTLLDNEGNKITGNGLMGAYFTIDGVNYYPNVDGSTRVKIADKVGNAESWIILNTENASIATGDYKIDIETFGSPDGIYYGDTTSSNVEIPITIINTIYGLKTTMSSEDVIKNSANTYPKTFKFTVNYSSGLNNPNLRMSLYRRKYDTVYDTNYELVDLANYTDSVLFTTNNPYEYLLSSNPTATIDLIIPIKDDLLTGTYRADIMLYDNNVKIGTSEQYIIIK